MRREWLQPVKSYYNQILAEWNFDDSEIEMLMVTCDRLNRFYKCRKQIEKDGQSYRVDTGPIKCHPLLVHEKQAFMNFLAGVKALNLNEEEFRRPAHRPAGKTGYTEV